MAQIIDNSVSCNKWCWNNRLRKRTCYVRYDLTPATLDADALRELDAIIPEPLRVNMFCSTMVGKDVIEAGNVDDFLQDVAGEVGFKDFFLEAWNDSNYIILYCDSYYNYVSYHWIKDDGLPAYLADFLANVQAVFNKQRCYSRFTTWLLAKFCKHMRASKLVFGG